MVAYKHHSVLPTREPDIQNLVLFVGKKHMLLNFGHTFLTHPLIDRKHEAVILPIFGVPTPFHISMIKIISKSEEGSFTYLRINFFYPGRLGDQFC